MKENFPFSLPKNTSAMVIAKNLAKYSQQRGRLLKQLEQLGLDMSEYEHMPLKELTSKTQVLISNTYSIKYLGLNKNEMGIISRRINPLLDKELKIQEQPQDTFSVHKYFYPKPLKTGKKCQTIKTLNVENLESEIKREFEEKRTEDPKKTLSIKKDEKGKTRMMGSWYSASKSKTSHNLSGKS